MQGSKRVFRAARSTEEERKLLEDTIPKSTRDSTTWSYRIFNEWQLVMGNKDASLERCSFSFDAEKVQRLDTILTSMTTESLNFWLSKFMQEVCKQNGKRYPARTHYSIVCGIQRHLQIQNGSLAISLLAKDEVRYVL